MARLANYHITACLARRVAISLIALFLFGQGSVVLAACAMDRASMAQAMTAMAPDESCACGGTEMQSPVNAGCMAHCTADLQMPGLALALVHAAAPAPVLVVPTLERYPGIAALHVPPPAQVPRRILLHSFLI
jgi:hypothetical protein